MLKPISILPAPLRWWAWTIYWDKPRLLITSVSTCNSAWNECINLWSHSSALREQRVSIIILSPAVPSCLASLRCINACKYIYIYITIYDDQFEQYLTKLFSSDSLYRCVDKWWLLVTNMKNPLTTIFTRATNLMYCLEDYFLFSSYSCVV